VCLKSDHIIKGDVCIYPPIDGSPPADDKFFCGLYDHTLSNVILLGFCNRKHCESCVDITLLMNNNDSSLSFYSTNWDKTLMCPGTQCVNGTLTHKTPVRTMLETYVDIPIGLGLATLLVLIFILFIELFMCICRLLWIDASIYKNKIL